MTIYIVMAQKNSQEKYFGLRVFYNKKTAEMYLQFNQDVKGRIIETNIVDYMPWKFINKKKVWEKKWLGDELMNMRKDIKESLIVDDGYIDIYDEYRE